MPLTLGSSPRPCHRRRDTPRFSYEPPKAQAKPSPSPLRSRESGAWRRLGRPSRYEGRGGPSPLRTELRSLSPPFQWPRVRASGRGEVPPRARAHQLRGPTQATELCAREPSRAERLHELEAGLYKWIQWIQMPVSRTGHRRNGCYACMLGPWSRNGNGHLQHP